MSSPSDIYLPRTLPYPITIIDLHVRANDDVKRGGRLLSYSYRTSVPGVSTASTSTQTSYGTWDAPVDGKVTLWNISKGETLDKTRATARAAVVLEEPCKHGLQMGGLCAICGKDMTALDYTGYSDSARANIQMTHLAGGPTVSLEEARRLENETAERLLAGRRLSLIVDLDQTIVHATVDPTVGEWISQGAAWEAYQNEPPDKRGTPPSEPNANWDALRDVANFTLPHEGPGQHHHHREPPVMYYIKPRPGLMQFLDKISEKYEMHVYTMGTRAYAERVCAAIDPDGRLFGKRILSRDESGSLTAKSLQRLFPCDTSMVVIIDDRADVWDRSPNLVEVVRYDFFVGIGDINSTFLPPKADPLLRLPPDLPAIVRKPTGPQPVTVEDAKEELEDELLSRQAEALDAQVMERPLEKKQHELEEHEHEHKHTNGNGTVLIEHPKEEEKKTALLRNDDTELARLQHILSEVHERYFKLYDARRPTDDARRKIIPSIKAQTFAGMHFLFSSVIPLDVRPEESPIWRQAQEFGATCHSDVSPRLTHVITAKRSTAKVDAARRRGDAHIVWVQWFLDSTSVWHAQDVRPYLVDVEADHNYRSRRERKVSSASAPAEETRSTTPPPAEQEDEEAAMMNGGFDEEELGTVDVDWDAINAEVEAAMNETDDDGDEASGWGTPRSRTRSPRGVKRRERSVESDATTGSTRGKRSKLREEVTADDDDNPAEPPDTQEEDEEEEDEADGTEDGGEDWDEDFLAQELGVES
ncbi:hypothetical protein EXIGLDRAFT_704804 [Exidia glandulosa HHB12029]|uniref:RNA polymerase II subunit A C-terminal domain phosphatase n=1 Tax=Exidia glandulosa HHB12029 TaxID=1314781 RepID=A0A165KSV9_EXIGL|nr:hypothetical protein EXIGLDRAFT_704804 [Exidia glandulosa HHB12029]